jgi:N-6 DNA Methylase
MATLSRDLRRQLEKTVAEARKIAEEGAEQSLHRLAVELPRPHDALNEDEKKLRVSLRAHAKQLGDQLDQRPARLIQAVAYEHWHRLLFARFLIENDLLLHPEHGVALSLDEVKEVALADNREWVEVAAEYAHHMLLRRVFQPEDPALRVLLAPEKRRQLEERLNSLPREVFLADDSLGWVYQFWQKDAKEAVNEAQTRIGADELAPVTQLFTEDYMVLFLLENTLGAWWTARRGKPQLPGYTWTYLRLNDDGTAAAGTFDDWPKHAKGLRVLDPCMGSGHFLTFALPILARIRMEEEGLPLKDSILSVIRDNLFGLELDPRCSQIAAFNLALTAWRLAGEHFPLPELNLACSGLGINAKEEEWVKLAGYDGRKQDLMRWLYSIFSNAPTLGSLIDPGRVGTPMEDIEMANLLPLLEQALAREESSDDTRELAIAAQGLLGSTTILSRQFHLVVTNVPYLKTGNMAPPLKQFTAEKFALGKADLATCFVERCLSFCLPGGTAALVSPQNWLFQPGYIKLRKELLQGYEWNFLTELGSRAFETITGEVVKVSLTSITKRRVDSDHCFASIDVSNESNAGAKAAGLKEHSVTRALQLAQLANPEHRIISAGLIRGTLLSAYAQSHKGITTNDDPRFVRKFWEMSQCQDGWEFHLSTVKVTCPYGGREQLILYESGKGGMRELAKSQDRDRRRDLQGVNAWGKWGIAVSCTGSLPVSLYTGEKFDTNVAVLIPNDPNNLGPIYAFCQSPEFARSVRRIDKALKVTNATLVKIPYEHERWRQSTAGSLPTPESNDPTQWLFSGAPVNSEQPLQTAVARLLGYRWPRQSGCSFLGCPALKDDDLEWAADEDGIVCLSAVAGADGAAVRLRALLQASFGHEYNLAQLLQGKRSKSLEVWLRDEFFEEHCSLFRERPFVWHVWDGLQDGFHALVNYHKLDRQNLEKLIYTYLGDWIGRQRQDVANGVEGADGRLPAAQHLQAELKLILEGESPYDVFVRWKPLKEQPIGWNPDLNDGIRVNIRPWITAAQLYSPGRKASSNGGKSGILRTQPNITYKRDPGNEQPRDSLDFPWFEGTNDRRNDVHLSLQEKREARGLR